MLDESDAAYSGQLDAVRGRLQEMADRVGAMMRLSVRAVLERDATVAAEAIASDDAIDDLDVVVEAECMHLTSKEQPVAADLRFVASAVRGVSDLERIADHLVDIAKIGRGLATPLAAAVSTGFEAMAAVVTQMLADAVSAFVMGDLEQVQKVVEADERMINLYAEQSQRLSDIMRSDPGAVDEAIALLFASQYLERIADHLVNIAERVYMVETGHLAQLARSHRSQS